MEAHDPIAAQLFALRGELAKKKVLLVDRLTNARDALRAMLANLGVTSVSGVGSAQEVLRKVRKTSFDLILSDYHLDDGRDGQQLLEELRLQRLIPLSTAYLIVTAERGLQNVASVAELTPDDYLIKPFTGDQLQQRLVRVLYKKYIFATAYQALERGDYAKALVALQEVADTQKPYNLDARRLIGETLNRISRFEEAEIVFRDVLSQRFLPWAQLGLATALRGRGQAAEAEKLMDELIGAAPKFLAAYDFLAGLQEERGATDLAQATLTQASDLAPHNTVRLRQVGEVALRNDDLDGAEKAFSTVLTRARVSSLRSVDDYGNLARTKLAKGDSAGTKALLQEIRRDWRGDKQGELAALTMESLVQQSDGDEVAARKTLEKALVVHQEMLEQVAKIPQLVGKLSRRLAVDLAHACLSAGQEEKAMELLRQVAAEHNEDRSVIAHIEEVFEKTGRAEAGRALLDSVTAQIVELNNQGVEAARGGDLDTSIRLLMAAADKIPNIQFLSNAAKAIFTYLDQKGWEAEGGELSQRAIGYLKRARAANPQSPRVVTAWQLYQQVGRKYGIAVPPITAPDEEPIL